VAPARTRTSDLPVASSARRRRTERRGVKGTTGTATPYIPPGDWAAVVGRTVLLAGAATMLPLLRMRPVEAIGIRE